MKANTLALTRFHSNLGSVDVIQAGFSLSMDVDVSIGIQLCDSLY